MPVGTPHPRPVGTSHPHIQRAHRQPPGPTLTTHLHDHLHTYLHTHCPRIARPPSPTAALGLCLSSLAPLWLGSLDSPAKTPPWPPGKPGETLLVSPTCSQGPQPGLLHGQLRGLRSRPGGVWGCGKGPPPRPPPAPWNSLSTAASLIPALPAGWLSPWSGAARRGRVGLGGLSHQAARRPQSPGQGG